MESEPNSPDYSLERDENGLLLGVRRHSDGWLGSPDVPEFVKWNREQARPLDASSEILPVGHRWFERTSDLIEYCKTEGILLFHEDHPYEPAGFYPIAIGDFPNKARLARLSCAESVIEKGSGPLIGLGPTKSNLWVREELLPELNNALQDDASDVRKASTWAIRRTFVYLDVSDFSKFPSGQQALVINSINRIVGHQTAWDWYPAQGANRAIEARICIGDGYIFVFKSAKQAAVFACTIAYLIETLRASSPNRLMPVDFHFRIGVHSGSVFCFWDPGRSNWNYIGDGINGGQRVLAAAGKEKDHVVFISDYVRTAILADSYDRMNDRPRDMDLDILNSCHNRGRRSDKHGTMWRLYEANHTEYVSTRRSHVSLMSDLMRS